MQDQYGICQNCRYAEFEEDDLGRRFYVPEECRRRHEPSPNSDCDYYEEIEDVRW